MGYNIVVDIETDGLFPACTVVHLICILDVDTKEVLVYYDEDKNPYIWPCIAFEYPQCKYGGLVEDAIEYMNEADLLAGHNWKGFDHEVLKEFFGDFDPQGLVLDTFSAACLMFPEYYARNSLEAFAKRLRLPVSKIQVDDWSHIHLGMVSRCIHDVIINDMVLSHLYNIALQDEAQHGIDWMDSFMIEGEVSRVHCHQTAFGVWFDARKAECLVEEWDIILKGIEKSVVSQAPLTAKKVGVEVKLPFLKSGHHSKMVRDWFEDDELGWIDSVRGEFTRIEWLPLNVNSHSQVKDFLLTLGWKPTEWNSTKTDGGGFKRTSPKLTEDSFESLPPGLGQDLADYFVLAHRRGILMNKKNPDKKGAFSNLRDDGRIAAEAMTCATPTSRYRHSGTICNTPGVDAPYGKELRSCFGAGPGEDEWQVGSDLSAIDGRMLVNRCFTLTKGKEFAELVLDGDWHTHNADIWKVKRTIAKRILYAMNFGAGDKLVGSLAGGGKARGAKIKSAFFEATPAYEELLELLLDEYINTNGFIIGLDGRKFFVRNKKDLLMAYMQGNAAVIFKYWMVDIANWAEIYANEHEDIVMSQMIGYHDEVQYYVKGDRKHAEALAEYGAAQANEVGKKFNFNIKLAAESKIGRNWLDCH